MQKSPTKEQLVELYINNGLNLRQTSKKCQRSYNSVKRLLIQYNIPIKTSGRQQKYFANEQYFSKWSHNMAYCLGFIAADGHVWKNRPYITIGISEKDKQILEFIRDNISPTTKVRYSNGKVQINVYSKGIVSDLKRYNVTNSKTFNMKLDFHIPKKYFGDYLRGFFDGDGSIWEVKNKQGTKTHMKSSFACASKQFLIDIQNKINIGTIRVVRGKYYELSFGQAETLLLYDIMYENKEGFRLARKYDKFLQIKQNPNRWTKKETNILFKYKTKIKLIQKLPNRTWDAIRTQRKKIINESSKGS